MIHPERADDYLAHIVQAIDRAIRYSAGLDSAAALQRNDQIQDAIIRNIEIIGEAAVRLQRIAPDFVAAHPDVPWIEMRGMRNKMIHQYFDVDWDIVWATIKNDLPRLKQRIEALLGALRRSAP